MRGRGGRMRGRGGAARGAAALCVTAVALAGGARALRIPLAEDFSETVVLDAGADSSFRARTRLAGGTFQVLLEKSLSVRDQPPPEWLGFGVADQTSGHMLGSDIFTIHLEDPQDSATEVRIVDRYVPWASYPYSASDLYPRVDAHADWCLDAYEFSGDPGNYTFAALVSRLAVTNDPYDNDILEDWDSLLAIWAFGAGYDEGEMIYHGRRRGSTMVPLGNAQMREIPADAEGSVDILFSEYALPTRLDTYYSCQGFDLSSENKRHILAIEPIIQTENAAHVHHIVVHRCKAGQFFNDHLRPVACTPDNADDPLDMHSHGGDSPVGTSGGDCEGLLYVWAAGAGLFVMPDEAGIPIGGEENSHLIVEIHYDNPDRSPGIVDSSGFRIHYTETLRQHDAATMNVGDPLVSEPSDIDARVAQDHRQYVCPEACTDRFAADIQVFGSAPHMHYTGRSIWTTVSREGQYLADLDRKEYWNNGFQKAIYRKEPFTVKAGDRMTTHCVFDTQNYPRPVGFGSTTKDEMCMNFLFYYPRQQMKKGVAPNELAYCGPNVDASEKSGTAIYICGSPEAPSDVLSPWIQPGGKLEDKFDPPSLSGGRASYRFDEGLPASTAADICVSTEVFEPEKTGPDTPEPEKKSGGGKNNSGGQEGAVGRPAPEFALSALLGVTLVALMAL